MKKIITCTGYHGTGSSLIVDYLSEFEEISTTGNFEFRFLQDPNGVADLEDRLLNNNARLNSDRAIYEYLKLIKILNSNYTNRFWEKSLYKIFFRGKFLQYAEEYIEDLVETKWYGYWHDFYFRDYSLISRIKYFILGILGIILKKNNIGKKNIIYYSYPIKDFYKKTKKYMNKLFSEISEKEIIAVDQLVPCCNTSRYLNYFDDIKIIIVDRDPRDLYVLNKMIWKESVVPCDDVDLFIKHFKALREHQLYEKEDKNYIMRIKFEDAIYNYEETMKKINKFLGIENLQHTNPKKYFNPDISINNTQIFSMYPELEEDIKKIEKNLGEYCYSFNFSINNLKRKVF